jgi:Sulfotransferase family
VVRNAASAYAAQRAPASYPSCVEKETGARATRPVFVVGCPRSGTTLLYHMILSSGGFAVFPLESGAFAFLGRKFPNLKSLRERQALLEFWLQSEWFVASDLDRTDIEQRVLEECRNIGDFLRIVMEMMCRKQGVRRWAEKSPTHALFIPEIKRLIPDSLIVHIIRDGRDVALSLSNFGRLQPFLWARAKPLLSFGLYWEWMVRRARFDGQRIGPDYYELHYEDLLSSPEGTLARLGDFIAHDLDYDRIRRAGFGSVGRPDSSFHGMTAPGDFKPVGRWKQKCSPRELVEFETLMGDCLEQVGYTLATNPQDTKSTLSAIITRAFYTSQLASIHWLRNRRVLRRLVGRKPARVAPGHQ